MKLISWNVNGIRASIKKGFFEFVKKQKPDLLCLQEVKISSALEAELSEIFKKELPGYEQFWNHAQKPGYSGTLILSSVKPLRVSLGINIPKHDQEGRVVTLEFKDFYLVNVYVPNSQRELTRLPYRTKEWDVDFLKYLKNLEKKKPVIFCGDLNVAHQEIDLANPKANVKNHGFTPEERAGFDKIIQASFIDTFREFNKEGQHYTWWSPMGNCRARNIGWRIDYFCISPNLRPFLKDSFILKDVMGSDHCPIGILLEKRG